MFRCLIRLQLIQLAFTRMVWISLSFVLRASTTTTSGWRRRRSNIHTIEYFVSCWVEKAFILLLPFFFLFLLTWHCVTGKRRRWKFFSLVSEMERERDGGHQFAWCQRMNGKHKRLIVAYVVIRIACLFYSHSDSIDWIYSVRSEAEQRTCDVKIVRRIIKMSTKCLFVRRRVDFFFFVFSIRSPIRHSHDYVISNLYSFFLHIFDFDDSSRLMWNVERGRHSLSSNRLSWLTQKR